MDRDDDLRRQRELDQRDQELAQRIEDRKAESRIPLRQKYPKLAAAGLLLLFACIVGGGLLLLSYALH